MRWFTSDHHFGHKRICELAGRPFDSVEEMNETMIHNWNQRVAVDDTVYVLGDFAMGTIAETLLIARVLNGHKILIPGNHDRCWPGAPRREVWLDAYRAAGFTHVWDDVRPMVLILGHDYDFGGYYVDGGFGVALHHLPYEGDYRGRTELEAMRPPDTGGWLIHGHVHELWKIRGRQVNVGVDVHGFAPVSEDELMRMIRGEISRNLPV